MGKKDTTLTVRQIKNLLKKGKDARAGMAALVEQVSDLSTLVQQDGIRLKDAVDNLGTEKRALEKEAEDLTTLHGEITEFLGEEEEEGKAE